MMGGSPESGGVASAPGVCKVETDQAVGWGWGAGGPSHLASTLPLLPETCRPWGASPGAQVPVTSKTPGPLCPLCPLCPGGSSASGAEPTGGSVGPRCYRKDPGVGGAGRGVGQPAGHTAGWPEAGTGEVLRPGCPGFPLCVGPSASWRGSGESAAPPPGSPLGCSLAQPPPHILALLLCCKRGEVPPSPSPASPVGRHLGCRCQYMGCEGRAEQSN